MTAPSLLRVGDLLLAGGPVPDGQVGAIIEHIDNRGGTTTISTNLGAFTVNPNDDIKRKERKERDEEDTPFVPMTVTADELRVGDMVVAGGGVPTDDTGWGDSSVVQEASANGDDTWTVRTETAEFKVPAEAILTVYHDVPDGTVNPDDLDDHQRAVWDGIPEQVQARMTSPEVAAAMLMGEDPVTPAAYQAAFYTNRRGVRVWHDPTTGKFAPAGFVSMALLRRLWKGDTKAGMEFDDAVRKLRGAEPDITLEAAAARLLGPAPEGSLGRLYQDAARRRLRQFWRSNRRLGRSVPGEPLSPNEARARTVLDRLDDRQIDATQVDIVEPKIALSNLGWSRIRDADGDVTNDWEYSGQGGGWQAGDTNFYLSYVNDTNEFVLTRAPNDPRSIDEVDTVSGPLPDGASPFMTDWIARELAEAAGWGEEFRAARPLSHIEQERQQAERQRARAAERELLTDYGLVGPDRIARGMKIDLPYAQAQPFIDGTATADDVLNLLDRDRGVGIWWGLTSESDANFDISDFQDYADYAQGEWNEEGPDSKWMREHRHDGYLSIVMFADRPPGWDPSENPDTSGRMLGSQISGSEQSYIDTDRYGNELRLRGFQYKAGDGKWRTVPVQGDVRVPIIPPERDDRQIDAVSASDRFIPPTDKRALRGADLSGRFLSGVDLSGYDLRGVDLSESGLEGANLAGADLTGADLWAADLTDADLTGANLTDASLESTTLRGGDLTAATLPGANLRNANLVDVDLSGADLTGANLTDANLIGVNLTGANLTGADLRDAADIIDADLTGANLTGARLPDWFVLPDATRPVDRMSGRQIDAVAARVIPMQPLPDTPEMREPGAVEEAAAELSRANPDVNVFVTSAGFGPGLYGSRSVLAADINQSSRDGYWRNGEFKPFTDAARQRADRISMREADAAALGRGGDGGQTLARQARRRQRLRNQYRRDLDIPSDERPVGTRVKLFGTRYTKQADGSWDGRRYDRETGTRTQSNISAAEYDALRVQKREQLDAVQSGQSVDALQVPEAVTDLIDRIRAVTGPVKNSPYRATPMRPGELVNEPGMSDWEAEGLARMQKLGQYPVGLPMEDVDLWAEIDFAEFDDPTRVGPAARILVPNSDERRTIDALMSAGTLYRKLPDFDTESRSYKEAMYSLTWDARTARWTARRSLGDENGPFVYGYSDDSAYEAMDAAGFRDEDDRVFNAWLDTPNMDVQIDAVNTVAGPAVRPMSVDEAQTAADQIGAMTVAAISGGRKRLVDGRLVMPAGAGYQVRVSLDGDDTYTVERVFSRGGVDYPKGSVSGVYADQLSDVAFRAALYSDGPFGQTARSIDLLNMPSRPYDNLFIDDERLVPYTFGPAPTEPTPEEAREMARQMSLADPDQYVTLIAHGGPDDRWLYQSNPVVQRQRRLSPFAPLHTVGWADGYWKNGEFTPFTPDDEDEAKRLSRELFPLFYDDAAEQPESPWGEAVAPPRVRTEQVLMAPVDITVGGTAYDTRLLDQQTFIGSLRYDPPPEGGMPPVTGGRWTVRSPEGDTIGYLQSYGRRSPTTGLVTEQRWFASTDSYGLWQLLDENYDPFTTPEEAARALLEGRVRLQRDLDTEWDRLDVIRRTESERWRADAEANREADDVSIDLLVGDYVRTTRPDLLRQRDEASVAQSVRDLQSALGAFRPTDPPRAFDGGELTAAAVWYNRDNNFTQAEIEAGVPTVQVLVGTNPSTFNRHRLVVMAGVQLPDGRFVQSGPPSVLYRTNVQRYQTGQAGPAWRQQIARKWAAPDVAVVTGVSEGGADGPGAPVVLDPNPSQTVDMMNAEIAIYEVGGAVRDELMGIESNDVDFAVTAPSYEAMKAYLEEQGFRIFQEKPEFVTIKAQPPEGSPLRDRTASADFVLARRDGPSSDGRRPDYTEPGSLEDDLARRDFTVNAIARDAAGQLIDPHNGQDDLRNRVLRFVGDPVQRVREDGLRVLRGYRFMVTKGLTPEEATWAALTSSESAEMLRSVSKERIADELQKMFDYDTISAVQLLGSLPDATLAAIFPEGVRLAPNLRKMRGASRDRTIDPVMVDGWLASRPFVDENGDRLSWPEVSNRLTGGMPVIGFDETDGPPVRAPLDERTATLAYRQAVMGQSIDAMMAPNIYDDTMVVPAADVSALNELSGAELEGSIGAMSTDALRAALLSGSLDPAVAALVRSELQDRSPTTIDAVMARPSAGSTVIGPIDGATMGKAVSGDRAAILKLDNRARLVREQNPSWDAETVARAVLGPAPSYKWEPSAYMNWDAARRHIRGERSLGRRAVEVPERAPFDPDSRWQWNW